MNRVFYINGTYLKSIDGNFSGNTGLNNIVYLNRISSNLFSDSGIILKSNSSKKLIFVDDSFLINESTNRVNTYEINLPSEIIDASNIYNIVANEDFVYILEKTSTNDIIYVCSVVSSNKYKLNEIYTLVYKGQTNFSKNYISNIFLYNNNLIALTGSEKIISLINDSKSGLKKLELNVKKTSTDKVPTVITPTKIVKNQAGKFNIYNIYDGSTIRILSSIGSNEYISSLTYDDSGIQDLFNFGNYVVYKKDDMLSTLSIDYTTLKLKTNSNLSDINNVSYLNSLDSKLLYSTNS
jgi:hypothetical protein